MTETERLKTDRELLAAAGCRCTGDYEVATAPNGRQVLFCPQCLVVAVDFQRTIVTGPVYPLAPHWSRKDLEKWAKAELGPSAIVMFTGDCPKAQTADVTGTGYKIRNYKLAFSLDRRSLDVVVVILRWEEETDQNTP